MELPCDGFVLLVGDGDFSFTRSLVSKDSLKASAVTTSNLETIESIQQHKQAAENMNILTEMGVQVFLETDARELHTHPAISRASYQRIIFNFPLADRHNIKLNRALLADFFSSCSQILSDTGQVMVTLCKGQGGTPADQPMRSWHDSWQVQAMATNAGFILTQVLPFDVSVYPLYHSVGFRFQDKSFNTDGALIHVFEKADVVAAGDSVCARGVVKCGGEDYASSRYVADKFSRDLLEEPNHPLSLLRQHLEKSLSGHLGAEIVPDKDGWCVLPGHKSSVSTHPTHLASNIHHLQDSQKTVKDRKNEANLTILHNAKTALITHGVDRQNGLEPSGNCCQDQDICRMLPDNPESVFILIRKNPLTDTADCKKKNGQSIVELVASPVERDYTADGCCGCPNPDADTTSSLEAYRIETEGCGSQVMETTYCVPADETSTHLASPCTERVYHCRTSLLENFKDLHPCVSLENVNTNSSSGLVNAATTDDYLIGQCEHEIRNSRMSETISTDRQCFVVSGRSFLPGPITADTLSVRHEMMIVQKIPHESTGVQFTTGANMASTGINMAAVDEVTQQQNQPQDANSSDQSDHRQNRTSTLNHVLSCLVQCLQTAVKVEDVGRTASVSLVGVEKVTGVKLVYLEPATNTRQTSEQPPSQHRPCQVLAGVVCQVVSSGEEKLVVLLHLDNIVCQICSIDDPRILWSQSKRFTDQFQPPSSSFPPQFQQFSLFPMRFTHDLSFWQNDSDSEFDVTEMYNIILYTAGDLVYSVSLRDIYTDPDTGRVSRCYRLRFTSHDQALPYLTSWKLQSLIRMEVAQKLGVTLR
ncbi:unnamed protein product [Candidula unifasciata]|uniref:FDX-ACB domain-containing protein n=1 Tax=Candidula unifasciata TaxID=100452 RepID=A0A8S4A579_9EUPU|nr:unnamed protein product [Candidula unifasciata]